MSVSEIFCQDRAIERLQRAFGVGRMAHAYIFAGHDGVGKFKTAREWAKMLLCSDKMTKGNDADSCGKCRSCMLFEGDGHPDFHHIYKELKRYTSKGKKEDMPIDLPKIVIDEFLIDKVAARPTMGEYVVYVVSEAEKLNAGSQNALLKVLEEPPANCVIILLCSRVEKMLPTTLSRCQVLQFGPIDEQIIIEKLISMGVGKNEATYWARFSGGSLGGAIDWAGLKPKGASCYEIKTELVKRLSTFAAGDAIDLAEWISAASKGISAAWSDNEAGVSKKDITRRAQKGLLQMIIAVFSDVMRLGAGGDAGLVNTDQMSQVQAVARRFDVENAARQVDHIAEKGRWVDASVNEKLIFEELLLNLAGCGILMSSL
jgi:DNA polymerase-3 subunit delta'